MVQTSDRPDQRMYVERELKNDLRAAYDEKRLITVHRAIVAGFVALMLLTAAVVTWAVTKSSSKATSDNAATSEMATPSFMTSENLAASSAMLPMSGAATCNGQDKYYDCYWWTVNGFCRDAQWGSWMISNCAKSCNECWCARADSKSTCVSYSPYGKCTDTASAQHLWMKDYCKKTCTCVGICGASSCASSYRALPQLDGAVPLEGTPPLPLEGRPSIPLEGEAPEEDTPHLAEPAVVLDELQDTPALAEP